MKAKKFLWVLVACILGFTLAAFAACGEGEGETDVPATGVTLSETTLALEVGETSTLTAVVTPEDSTDTVVWSTSAEAVATVSNGTVTAVAEGTATITATAGDVNATCTVTVTAAEEPGPSEVYVESVTISDETLELEVGETFQLSAAIEPENATDKELVWSVDEDFQDIVTVDENGLVTAVGAGEAVVFVGSYGTEDGTVLADFCSVTVTEKEQPAAPVITAAADKAQIVAGEQVTLTWSATEDAQVRVTYTKDGAAASALAPVSGEAFTIAEAGVYVFTFAADGAESKSVTVTVTAGHVHSYTWSVADDAQPIGQAGVATGVCACGESTLTRELPQVRSANTTDTAPAAEKYYRVFRQQISCAQEGIVEYTYTFADGATVVFTVTDAPYPHLAYRAVVAYTETMGEAWQATVACIECGATKTVAVPAVDAEDTANWAPSSEGAQKAPTCTEAGFASYQYEAEADGASVLVIVTGVPVPATGHSYTWAVAAGDEPGKGTPGVATGTCTLCAAGTEGHTAERELPGIISVGSDGNVDFEGEPQAERYFMVLKQAQSCTQEAIYTTTYTFADGDAVVFDLTVLPAAGHTYVLAYAEGTVSATCGDCDMAAVTATVTFAGGDGATGATVPAAEAFAFDGEVFTLTLPQNGFVNDGSVFAGWQIGEEASPLQPGATATVAAGGTLTVTAVWTEKNTVTVDGDVVAALDEGDTYVLTAPAAQSGKTFMGWVNGDAFIVADAEEAERTLTMGTENIVLTTKWADHAAIAAADELLAAFEDAGAASVTLSADIELRSTLFVDRAFEIDLNGKTLSFASTQGATLLSLTGKGAVLTVKGGDLAFETPLTASTPGTDAAVYVDKGASLTLDGVDLTTTSSALWVADSSKLTINGGSVTAGGVYAIGTNASKENGEYLYAPVTINVTGTVEDPVEITAQGGYLSDTDKDGVGFLINVPGNVTFKYVALKGARQGLVVRGGAVTVENSTITTEGAYTDGLYLNGNWGSGSEVPQAAVTVGDRSNAGAYACAASLTLTNTTVTVAEGAGTGVVPIYVFEDSDTSVTIVTDLACSQLTIGAGSAAIDLTAGSHTYAYVSDGENGHHQACSNCGAATATEAHTYGDDYTAEGEQHYRECTACSYREYAAHTLQTASDETDHWQACSVCGYETATEAHSLTYVSDGENGHHQECSVCDYETAHTAHNLTYVSDGENGHHQECSGCGYETAHTAHNLTYVSDGENGHHQECSGCDYETATEAHSGAYTLGEDGTKVVFTCTECRTSYDRTITGLTPVGAEDAYVIDNQDGTYTAVGFTVELVYTPIDGNAATQIMVTESEDLTATAVGTFKDAEVSFAFNGVTGTAANTYPIYTVIKEGGEQTFTGYTPQAISVNATAGEFAYRFTLETTSDLAKVWDSWLLTFVSGENGQASPTNTNTIVLDGILRADDFLLGGWGQGDQAANAQSYFTRENTAGEGMLKTGEANIVINRTFVTDHYEIEVSVANADGSVAYIYTLVEPKNIGNTMTFYLGGEDCSYTYSDILYTGSSPTIERSVTIDGAAYTSTLTSVPITNLDLSPDWNDGSTSEVVMQENSVAVLTWENTRDKLYYDFFVEMNFNPGGAGDGWYIDLSNDNAWTAEWISATAPGVTHGTKEGTVQATGVENAGYGSYEATIVKHGTSVTMEVVFTPASDSTITEGWTRVATFTGCPTQNGYLKIAANPNMLDNFVAYYGLLEQA